MEKVQVKIFSNETNALAEEVAQEIVSLINKNNAIQKSTILGLATGNTPLDVYRELIRLYKESKVDFSRVITFNLDEYYELHQLMKIATTDSWMTTCSTLLT